MHAPSYDEGSPDNEIANPRAWDIYSPRWRARRILASKGDISGSSQPWRRGKSEATHCGEKVFISRYVISTVENHPRGDATKRVPFLARPKGGEY